MQPVDLQLRKNIELKVRCSDLERCRTIAQELGAGDSGSEHQKDTYFRVSRGRLKVREIQGQGTVLIWYDRADNPEARMSRYLLVPVIDSEPLITALSLAVGVQQVIEKERRIFLYRNVRIHLDKVSGLGGFLEFEAVLAPGESEASGYEQLDWLCHQFKISDNDFISDSYEGLGQSAGI